MASELSRGRGGRPPLTAAEGVSGISPDTHRRPIY
jgi:hypothetical protein